MSQVQRGCGGGEVLRGRVQSTTREPEWITAAWAVVTFGAHRGPRAPWHTLASLFKKRTLHNISAPCVPVPFCGWGRTATAGSAAAAGGTAVRLRARTQQRELQSRWLHSSINSTHAHSHACKQTLMFQIYAPPSLLQEGSRVLNCCAMCKYSF